MCKINRPCSCQSSYDHILLCYLAPPLSDLVFKRPLMLNCNTRVTVGVGSHDLKHKTEFVWIENTIQNSYY